MIKYPTSLPKNLQIGFDAAHPLPPLSLDDDEPLLPPGLRVNMLYSQGNESCNWQIILWLKLRIWDTEDTIHNNKRKGAKQIML